MTLSRQNLSIIIVSFLSEHVIYKCIDSIPSDIKIIVVDNSNNIQFKKIERFISILMLRAGAFPRLY